ncbi:hypothetical protein COY27_05840 [Candidatus Woesearchaeota archaeon CG_4_10_14_0_2_um_filter_33_13]|nr:MAG: hypothetical protein COY27_05840 [Candidatus Woesearchaeota archaeon CG_4_10_14_0_2_um_filter_33_13]
MLCICYDRGCSIIEGVVSMENVEVELEELDEENIYSRKARAKLVDEDVLNNDEDGFMEGYEKDERGR